MSQIGFEHIYYVDTDSIFTDKEVSSLCGNELGKLKLEGMVEEGEATFIRAKFYLFGNEIKLKGFNVSQGADYIRMLIAEKRCEVPQQVIVKYKEAIRRKLKPLTMIEIPKRFELEYDYKRKLLERFSKFDVLCKLSETEAHIIKETSLMLW